jgi:hypothetical protein
MGIVNWSPFSIFVSLNKKLESGGGAPKFMFLFCLFEGALEILLILRGGQRKNIITVQFLLSPPCTINNEQSLKSINMDGVH